MHELKSDLMPDSKKSIVQVEAVVITRPLAQAKGFSEQVKAIGRKPEVFPMLEIHALADDTQLKAILARLRDFAMVAFVSPNAVNAVFSYIQSWPQNVTIAVMGAGSRSALATHGITDINAHIISPTNPERTDSETLLDELDLDGLKARSVLIIRGETGRELLADALRAKSIAVVQVAAYCRKAPEFNAQRQSQLNSLLSQKNTWVVTSSEVLKTMLSWAEQIDFENGVAKMQRQQILVTHARIAETAKILGFLSITLTGSGDERLLVALQSEL
ncbi:uroporphyrinogen-III synthase [Undibacterium sp.]|uniref:uroporphyrinogen-III synthase n=1 Tax=Undibacterium sp. TaxID=1914977 RepID=UPI0025D2E246|nr:uroporphyrinogen-III synthase [Undibacterium sp.]